MADDIDKIMTDQLPNIAAAVQQGLAAAPSLEKYVAVTTATDPMPYRAITMSWDHPPGHQELSQANPEMQGAYRFVRTHEVPELDHWINRDLGVRKEEVKTWAQNTRSLELRCVLKLIVEKASLPAAPFTVQAVETATKQLGGSCRLIGSGDVAKECAKQGVVAEQVDKPFEFPATASGILLRMDSGPLVTRLVDDLTLTWSRTSDSKGVDLTLSEMFFLDRPEVSRRLR